MAYSPEVYEVTAISFKKRLINSTLVGIPIVAIGLTSCLMAYKDKELTGILGGLLFFIAGCYLTRKIYTTKEKKEFKGIWEVMYEKNRMKNTLVALGMLGSILAVYIYSAHKQMLFNDGWWTYLIFVAIIARYLVPLWLPKRRFVLTSAALVEKQRQDNLNAQKSLENAKLWDDRMKR